MGTFAIVTALIAAIAAIGTGVASFASQSKANKFNQEQYEDWKSYNSPSAQMERLGQAGLNPYMVSGVNNTLSQPFAIGQNTGLSELFSGMSQSMKGISNTALGVERNDIQQQNAATRKTEANIHQTLAKLRERMVKIAEKRNDPMMALLWGQADAQTLANNAFRSTFDYNVELRKYQYLRQQQDFEFLSSMYPKQLDWYVPFQRAKVNQMLASANLANRQASHLDWLEPFQRDQFLFNQEMSRRNFILNKERFYSGQKNFYDRLHLSRNYYDLAVDKYWKDIVYGYPGWNFLGKPSRITKGGPGQFPSWTDYEYGF